MSESLPSEFCAVFLDTGTTNTRVWLKQGEKIMARASAMIGVRDTAREGSAQKLRTTLHDLIAEVRAAANDQRPSCVIGAGMITSPPGLTEIPHLPAPASLEQLAAATRPYQFDEVTDLPVLLVPGVRSGNFSNEPEKIGEADVMRGEETLCAGLIASGQLRPPATVLNLGSHWKTIQIDAAGRIAASLTSLAGEMIHAVQTTTILASAVPPSRPTMLAEKWCADGMREQRRSGLARALFCVRLLELAGHSSPAERFSFLVGAFIAAELDALNTAGLFKPGHSVFITGGGALAQAWRTALHTESIPALVLTEAEVETAFLTGLQHIAELCLTTR